MLGLNLTLPSHTRTQETLDQLPDMYRAQARRDEYGPLVMRMLVDLFAPFLKLKYLSLFVEDDFETYQQRERREKHEQRAARDLRPSASMHHRRRPTRGSNEWGNLAGLIDSPGTRSQEVEIGPVAGFNGKSAADKPRDDPKEAGVMAKLKNLFRDPNGDAAGVMEKDLAKAENDLIRGQIADQWHHLVASFREDERIASRIHELDEAAKRRFMMDTKDGKRHKVKLSIGSCWDSLRRYSREGAQAAQFSHMSTLNLKENPTNGGSSYDASCFLYDLKDLRMLEKTALVGMRDLGRMILHEMEVIIPIVAVALESVLSIAGESVYEEDDMNDELYIVLLGAVSLRDQDNIYVKGPGECFGEAVVMRLINDEPRKTMQHAAALTNCDMYSLSAPKFKDVISGGRANTLCMLAKRVAVRKTFKRMVPIIKSRLRYMNKSNEPLYIYIGRPYEW